MFTIRAFLNEKCINNQVKNLPFLAMPTENQQVKIQIHFIKFNGCISQKCVIQ